MLYLFTILFTFSSLFVTISLPFMILHTSQSIPPDGNLVHKRTAIQKAPQN